MTVSPFTPIAQNSLPDVQKEGNGAAKNKHRFLFSENIPSRDLKFSAQSTLPRTASSVPHASPTNHLVPWVVGALTIGALACMIFLGQSTQDHTHVMATEIPNIDAIQTLTNLGGVPIEQFEQIERGRGLLNDGDRLKAILLRDWKTVAALGVTHVILANIIDELAQITNGHSKVIDYKPTNLQNNLIGLKLGQQRLSIEDRTMSKCFITPDSFEKPHPWYTPKCNYIEIRNLNTNQTTGNIYSGMSDIIRRFGFYASGHYRIDTIQLVSVLTGQDLGMLRAGQR